MTLSRPRRTVGMGGGFGTPESIKAETLAGMPPVQQAEGLRLLMEMKQTLPQIRLRTGFSNRVIQDLLEGFHPLIRRNDASDVAAAE